MWESLILIKNRGLPPIKLAVLFLRVSVGLRGNSKVPVGCFCDKCCSKWDGLEQVLYTFMKTSLNK